MVTETQAYGQTVGMEMLAHTDNTSNTLDNPTAAEVLVTAGANGTQVHEVVFQLSYDIFTDVGTPGSGGVWRLFIGTATSDCHLFDEVEWDTPEASENLPLVVEYNEVRRYEHLYLESGEKLFAVSSDPVFGNHYTNYFAHYTHF